MKVCASVLTTALILLACTGAIAENLLKNAGFEDPAGWAANWTIKDAQGGNLTYHYHLTAQGGGHGDARPRSGGNALEIYSTDRRTYLAQDVRLEPGTYRLSAWARLNNTPDFCPVQLKLGEKMAAVPLASEGYRFIWADFTIEKAGDYEAGFHSPSYGIAIDDLCLEKVTEANAGAAPTLRIDLYPSSKDRAANIQYCLKSTPQWVNFAVTCLAPGRMKKPVMRILASEPVKLAGLNEWLINAYRMRDEEQVKLTPESIVREGRNYRGYSFPLPHFVTGYENPLTFGGCWVSNVPAKGGSLIMEIVDSDATQALETITLVTVDPPKRRSTPKRYYTFGYATQNWMQDRDERAKAMPKQFKMMGLNVWSDYGLTAEKPADGLTNEELVSKEAYAHGIRQFWPNFSSMIETAGGGVYSDASEKVGDKDMYVVTRDGKTLKSHYNFNYAANKGRAWMESAVAPWTRAQKRPIEKGLPFRYSGFVNDGLEGMPYSYDPTTLAAFAAFKGVDATEVTLEKLDTEWKRDWLLFSMDLYTRLVDVWVEELRKADPNVKIVNTASTYGPSGFDNLTPQERMKWAHSVDYNMPQWYASAYYGSAYFDQIKQGDDERVFGRQNGGTDLIPLLYLSMGGRLEDPEALRFKILDMCSPSKSVKGIGYYIATYAFCDAKFMVGLSQAHTLLADIEDYYADGVRDDKLVTLSAVPDSKAIPAMDMQGNQAMVTPNTSTDTRVHRLDKGGRIGLITIITHCEQAVGAKLKLTINNKLLPKNGKGLVLVDHLTGRRRALPDKIEVDTNKTRNVAVFEITER